MPAPTDPPLVEAQRRVRDALVGGDVADVVPLLVGGQDAAKRFAIHRRHYEASLVSALLGTLPATQWLVGTPFVTQAAEQFVRERPPHAPCIAEYGDDFPRFLAERPAASPLPYLFWFVELERHIGQVALAIEHPPMDMEALSGLSGSGLMFAVPILQPGTRYMQAPWPIDDLLRLYLTDTAPSQLALDAEDVWIEVRGARGAMDMKRMTPAEFMFRRAIREGQALGPAAEAALDTEPTFDPGTALAALVAEGLVTAITPSVQGPES